MVEVKVWVEGDEEPRLPEPKPVLRDYLYTANYREIV